MYMCYHFSISCMFLSYIDAIYHFISGGEGSFWVNNVVFDERWLGFRWLQMKLAVMVRH
ncbi:hypothetical protein Hanom_Chr11g01009901 [Helianthus anomalus]